jgi:alpha-amylase/alpha-mannosidase (GH57 family)
MIYWAPFLHFYQPPTQFHAILDKVSNESYRPLLKMLREHPNAKLTINICGILTEMLGQHSGQDIIGLIKDLAGAGQIEFTDSAKYHAILPLIPQEEMRRQIEQNRKTNSYFFKDVYRPRGFFPPEMCYSDRLAALLKDMGYAWVLVSGVACPDKWPLDVIYKIPFGLNVFYRDDILSNKISFHGTDSSGFITELVGLGKDKENIYVITAMDAETFGHHIHNWEKLFLGEVYEKIEDYRNYKDIKQRIDLAETHKEVAEAGKAVEVEVVTISELLEKIPEKDSKPPRPSSWSTTKDEILKKNYYPLWKGHGNIVHTLQWEHVKICSEFIKEAFKLEDNEESKRFYDISRALLDRAIHSCQFWWANRTRGMWDINLINKGLMLQEEVILNAYRSIKLSKANEEIKNKFYYKVVASRDVANKIRDQLFV